MSSNKDRGKETGARKEENAEAEIDSPSFPDLHHRLVLMLRELQEKRVVHTLDQREMSRMTMKSNEQERMLECERRSLSGLQVQLDFHSQSVRKKDAELETSVQKALRLEVQLSLAKQEIGVLRAESHKLEVQILELTQKAASLETRMIQFANFNESCGGFQDKVKFYLASSEHELSSLRKEVCRVQDDVEKCCKQAVGFDASVEMFETLQKSHLIEYDKLRNVLVEKQKCIDGLQKNMLLSKNTDKPNESSLTKELVCQIKTLEKSLASEKMVSKQLKDILSKAVQSQEILQKLESETNSKLSLAEAKLAAGKASEDVSKQEIIDLKNELKQLQISSKKAPTDEKSVQTDKQEISSEAQSTNNVKVAEECPEKVVTDSARNLDEVKRQFHSALTTSGDDWSKYSDVLTTK
ncbi:uncharacterized protein LOC132195666 [Neocloeon triangulifer]|uniref:uncharacterized protein LOC132195666 n=1 Tax=Neocloeon triangulifer TaxID=2078957 RepID=UPI00286EED3C|nr:uncharacterized protein LOC132195666 [Neocloeon triangulifer]XP_059473796.1 uncharacterized protein LOC132195666 [Neocloeon triangulifer]